MPQYEREVPVRALALERRDGALPRRMPGRVRRAAALGVTDVAPGGVGVSDSVGGFTLDALEAACVNLRSQGHQGSAQLVAKVADHPLNEQFPEARLVGILALHPAAKPEPAEVDES